MRFVRPLVLTAALVASGPSAGVADDVRILKADALPQPTSPIEITYCAGAIVPLDASSNLALGTRIQNVGTKVVKAVRFRFDLMTEFMEYDKGGLSYGSVDGDFKPGAKADLMSSGRNMFGRPLRKDTFDFFFTGSPDDSQMICSIDKVAFDDGTVWSADFHAELAASHGSMAKFDPPKFVDGALFGSNQGL